eukprot:4913269-Pyramimonas_sp.AAC.1
MPNDEIVFANPTPSEPPSRVRLCCRSVQVYLAFGDLHEIECARPLPRSGSVQMSPTIVCGGHSHSFPRLVTVECFLPACGFLMFAMCVAGIDEKELLKKEAEQFARR